MTTKPKARKYRIRRSEPLAAAPTSVPEDGTAASAAQPAITFPDLSDGSVSSPQPVREGQVDSTASVASETDINAIRKEGLTGRQLRMARRVAQKQGLAVTSDFDAVRQLRAKGIDPFQRANILELVSPEDPTGPQMADGGPPAGKPPQLPQTVPGNANKGKQLARIKPEQVPSTDVNKPSSADRRAGEIREIQRDIAKRRRKKLVMLASRLAVFVMLPTFIVGWYFAFAAAPMYATFAEFTVQKAEGSSSGIGDLFGGSGFGSQQDSSGVQSFLTSRDAMIRLDEEHGYVAHFSNPDIDAIQRLSENATYEEAYGLYSDNVKVGYDPTSGGLLKMEVVAASPEAAQQFSEALISYAEEMVDAQTERLRRDQMADARTAYQEAEERRSEALAQLVEAQQATSATDAASENSLILGQLQQLNTALLDKRLTLDSFLTRARPNQARVDALRTEIASIERQISVIRQEIGSSRATDNTALRISEENYTFQTLMVQQSLQSLEASRIEANRQITYLTLNVRPVAPDKATYPRVFENTMVAFLIFAGIYLMISLTASILREQVSS